MLFQTETHRFTFVGITKPAMCDYENVRLKWVRDSDWTVCLIKVLADIFFITKGSQFYSGWWILFWKFVAP